MNLRKTIIIYSPLAAYHPNLEIKKRAPVKRGSLFLIDRVTNLFLQRDISQIDTLSGGNGIIYLFLETGSFNDQGI